MSVAQPGAEAHPRNAGFSAPAGAAAIARLAAITTELAGADSMDEVVEISVLHMREAARAAVSTLLLRDGDELIVAGHGGVAEAKIARWARIPLTDINPASEAVRTRLPVVAATAQEVRERYPLMAPDTPARRSVICLPLNAGDQTLGAIGLTFDENWRPGTDELDFMMIVADTCAQTIRRVRATEDADRLARALRFLADASAELSRSLDYADTLAGVARLAVPALADWCAVDLLVNATMTTLAVAHIDPQKVAWAWELREQYPPDINATSGAPNVMRTGRSELHTQIPDDLIIASAYDDEHLRLMRELNMRSVMIVALRGSGQPIGAITFIRTDSSAPYTHADLAVAEDLGRRAGIAIENARLHEQTASVALQFQHAVLPENLDRIEGWEVDAHYSPNGNAEVGGDFFDAVAHPDGRLSVFIGDVVGHGVQAAAAMSQMRSALRAFLTVDPDPCIVVEKVDNMYEQLAIPPFVTLVFGLLEPDGAFRFVNAGHCPPLVVSAGGQTRYLSGTARPPIGVRPAAVRAIETRLERSDVLVLYTDGVVERRDESFEVGMATLAEHAARLMCGPLSGMVATLIEATSADRPSDDDVAAMAVRPRP